MAQFSRVRARVVLTGVAACLWASPAAVGQSDAELGRHFGFDEPRIIVIDDNPGPALAADLDGDGLTDLVVANNRKSRIEVFRQRSSARTDAEIERSFKVNELPPSRWFDRSDVSVPHRIMALRVHDVTGDGLADLVYAGRPAEVVVLRQEGTLTFEQHAKRRVRGLSAGQDGFDIADVRGDGRPELLALVDGRIEVYALGEDGITGEPDRLGSGGDLVAFFVEDYDGDGLMDIAGAIPEDAAPIRLWLQTRGSSAPVARGARPGSGAKAGLLGAEQRFELPGLIEMEPIRVPGRAAASLGTIERASRRIVLYDVVTEAIAGVDLTGPGVLAGERDAPMEVHAFAGTVEPSTGVATADLDGDGLLDVVVTDASTNSVAVYGQERGVGLLEATPFSAFKEPGAVATGQWDGSGPLEVFVLSEEEKTVGVASYDAQSGRLGFPQPLSIETGGATPVAIGTVSAELRGTGRDALAVIVRDGRDHTLELHDETGVVRTVELDDVNRPPQSIKPGDFDGDGAGDLLLFTPGEPLVMVRGLTGAGVEPEVLTDEDMPQFGLVQSAGPENTAVLDVDSDGSPELLIADANFVRATRFDAERGWRVVEQITMPDASTELNGLTVLQTGRSGVIVAADTANNRLILMSAGQDGAWRVVDMLRLTGFDLGAIEGGAFAGDGEPTILALSDSAFALIRLGGRRVALEEFAAYRSDEDDRLEHEMEVGDLNGDGFVDLVVLDAREQFCQVFSLSAARRLYMATEFKVFESRLFMRGDSRDYQPSSAIVEDVTGDGAADLLLEVHDRYILYPQTTR